MDCSVTLLGTPSPLTPPFMMHFLPTVLEMACNIKKLSQYGKVPTQEISVQNYTKKSLLLARVYVRFISKEGKLQCKANLYSDETSVSLTSFLDD